MTDPLSFPSSTPRFGLPLLFAGQAQKEVSVNAALALADTLLHPAVSGEIGAPPSAPAEGDCWLIGADPSGAFAGRPGSLAAFAAGTWQFVAPRDGMKVFDGATSQYVVYLGGWQRAPTPAEPVGGAVIDQEARSSIVALLHLLQDSGILAAE